MYYRVMLKSTFEGGLEPVKNFGFKYYANTFKKYSEVAMTRPTKNKLFQ